MLNGSFSLFCGVDRGYSSEECTKCETFQEPKAREISCHISRFDKSIIIHRLLKEYIEDGLMVLCNFRLLLVMACILCYNQRALQLPSEI